MKNIKKTLLLLLAPLAIHAGSNNAVIECKSGTGRTTLTFLDQDITGMFQGGKFTIDNKTITYLPETDYATIVPHMKEGVYTLYYYHKNILLEFYALPKSVKKVKKEGVDEFYKFNAVVDWSSTDPRTSSKLNKNIWLSCTMSYSI